MSLNRADTAPADHQRTGKYGQGRLAPLWTRETRPIPLYQRKAEMLCVCGCGKPVVEATRVMVPKLGFAADHQHAGIACAKLQAGQLAKR